MSRYHENVDGFVYQTFTKKKNNNTKKIQRQNAIIKFMKALIKFISQNHTDEITYVRLAADEPNEMRYYRKSIFNWNTQQKN